jgi:hypothetical protein
LKGVANTRISIKMNNEYELDKTDRES